MRKFFTVIAKIIATIFAILFVLTTILALFLTTLDRQVFNAKLYKNALAEQNIYERLPEIVGVALTSSSLSNPCAQNQLACNIDSASPDLQACLMDALGSDAYEAIGSGQRSPTEAELQLAQSCLDQYGNNQSGAGGTGDAGGMPPFMRNLTAADWQAILSIILPPDDLKTMVESTLDQLFAYLNAEADTVTVPLDKLKETLAGPAGTDLIMRLLNSQSPCTEQDLEQMVRGTSNGSMVLCKPPEDVLPLVVSILPDLLKEVVPQIPDKAIIIKPPAPGIPPPGTGPFGTDPITTLRTVRLIMRLSLLLPLFLLLLVTLFGVRSLKSWMRWWGIPFFVTGTIALGMGISALPILNVAWNIYIIPRIPPYIPADVAGIGLVLVSSIARSISGSIILQAVILLVVGLAAWGASYLLKTKIATPLPATPPTPAP